MKLCVIYECGKVRAARDFVKYITGKPAKRVSIRVSLVLNVGPRFTHGASAELITAVSTPIEKITRLG
jgi:hypothetical protein